MKKILFLLVLFSFEFSGKAQITNSQLISDIEQLQQLIESKHVRPFWINSRENFELQIKKSKEIISEKEGCDQSCYIELFKIVASIKDGHSSISSRSRYELFGYLPFSAKWFDGALYIVKTSEEYKKSLGYRITKVNGIEIREVLNKIRSVVPYANESRFKKFAGGYLHLPGLLYGLGITSDPKSAVFSFSNGMDSFDMDLHNMLPEEEEHSVFVSFLDDKDKLPLFQRNNDLYYWFEYDKNKELIYFQYNRVGNMEFESSSKFADRLWSTVDSVEVAKFVLDLRYNGGGSFPYSLPFIQGLLDRVDLSRHGALFVITGYDTFSAAILMLNQLELKSQAIIIGEAPCDHPASPGDSESYVLNNSQIKVNLSALYHPTIFDDDTRPAIILDKEIITNWKDYKSGIDPIMEYIMNFSNDEKMKIKVENYRQNLGKYEYSPTRNFELKNMNDELWLEIDYALTSPLYVMEENKFGTEVMGLSISIYKESIEMYFPNGKSKKFRKIDESSVSAIEYIYRDDFENAEKKYLFIKENNPNFIELKDHQMSFLASIAYFELMKYPDIDASKIARKILNLGIELNNGEAPFCEFSLRFY